MTTVLTYNPKIDSQRRISGILINLLSKSIIVVDVDRNNRDLHVVRVRDEDYEAAAEILDNQSMKKL